jgi:hypothetical protein
MHAEKFLTHNQSLARRRNQKKSVSGSAKNLYTTFAMSLDDKEECKNAAGVHTKDY